MARKYTYHDSKTGKLLFETVEPNYVSMDDVDKKMAQSTKRDPRLDPFVMRQIRIVNDNDISVRPSKPPKQKRVKK